MALLNEILIVALAVSTLWYLGVSVWRWWRRAPNPQPAGPYMAVLLILIMGIVIPNLRGIHRYDLILKTVAMSAVVLAAVARLLSAQGHEG